MCSSDLTSRVVVDALVIGVSLAVAAVPEGVAPILTIVLALGMQRLARRNVIVRAMWAGLLLVGSTMASGTLLMFDYGLPGGLIAGSGDVTYARTLAFTTLVLFQLFNVFSARSDREGAWTALFSNRWLWAAVLLSLAMQVAVVYLPALQRAFQTTPLAAGDWLACALVASSVVWVREGSKALMRRITAAR